MRRSSSCGHHVVANDLDEVPTLNGIEVQFDKVTLVNSSAQSARLQKLTAQLKSATEVRSHGIGAALSTAIITACQAVVNGKPPTAEAATIQAAVGSG